MFRIAKSFVLAVVLFPVLTYSAASAHTGFSAGLSFDVGFPQGELRDQIERNAYGIGGQVFYSPRQGPLAVGFELGWMNYGNESRREPFSSTIPDVTVEVETSNNIVQAFLILRGQLPKGPIQPYGDALIGFNYLFTETTIKDADDPSEEVASSTNRDDAAFAYGFGGGVMVSVYDGMIDSVHSIQVLLDGGIRYVLGQEAEYLKEGSIRRENGTVEYDMIKSRTDMLRLHVGVAIRF
jgi:hypothetical protein